MISLVSWANNVSNAVYCQTQIRTQKRYQMGRGIKKATSSTKRVFSAGIPEIAGKIIASLIQAHPSLHPNLLFFGIFNVHVFFPGTCHIPLVSDKIGLIKGLIKSFFKLMPQKSPIRLPVAPFPSPHCDLRILNSWSHLLCISHPGFIPQFPRRTQGPKRQVFIDFSFSCLIFHRIFSGTLPHIDPETHHTNLMAKSNKGRFNHLEHVLGNLCFEEMFDKPILAP